MREAEQKPSIIAQIKFCREKKIQNIFNDLANKLNVLDISAHYSEHRTSHLVIIFLLLFFCCFVYSKSNFNAIFLRYYCLASVKCMTSINSENSWIKLENSTHTFIHTLNCIGAFAKQHADKLRNGWRVLFPWRIYRFKQNHLEWNCNGIIYINIDGIYERWEEKGGQQGNKSEWMSKSMGVKRKRIVYEYAISKQTSFRE